MARLPVEHSDSETWGGLLNSFLSVSLNDDGTLRTAAVQTALGTSGGGAGGLSVLAYRETTTDLVSTSNTWKTGNGGQDLMGVSFTAPSSGIVYIWYSAHMTTSGTNGGATLVFVNQPGGAGVPGFGLPAASGSIEGLTLYCNANNYQGGTGHRRISGLTAGLVYSATCAAQLSGSSGTLTVSFRAITIMG